MDKMADHGDAREDAPESANDDEVVRLCGEGDGCAQQGRYDQAVLLYTQALDLLSVPLERHEAGAYILTAIGNAQFLTGDFDSAYQTLQHALRCPDGSTGPFIHLRLGQVLFQLGIVQPAANELAQAYMAGGKALFEGEDPRYFALVQSVLRAPADGVW